MPGVTDLTESYFKDGTWGWDGTQWRKLPLLWGYSDRWVEKLGGTFAAGGTYTKTCTTPPAGQVYVLQAISISNESGARGMSYIYVTRAGVVDIRLAWVLAPARYEPLVFRGPLVLKKTDVVTVRQLTCVANDVIAAGVWGYKMVIAE